jgi:hypothetical protein
MYRRLLTIVLLALAASPLPGEAAAPAPVSLRIVARLPAGLALPEPKPLALVKATPYGAISGALPSDATSVEVSGAIGSDLVIGLRADWFWRVEISSPGFWAAPALLSAPLAARDLVVDFLPAGKLTAKLVVPDGQPAPAEISVGIEASPELEARSPGAATRNLRRALPGGQQQCPVTQSRFVCSLPAGRVDLALRIDSFVTHYRWGVEVAPGKQVDLGTLALERGSAVSGWVVTRGASPGGPPATVELTALGRSEAASPIDAARLSSRKLGTRVDDRGFFHLTGVPAGAYSLAVTKEGFAPAISPAVQVFPDRETRLVQPIELELPVTASLWITPTLAPNGEPWRVEIGKTRSGSNYLDFVTEGTEPAPGGNWQKKGLAPGTYKLRVLDSTGTAFWADDVAWSASSSEVWVPLEVFEFAGEVWFGKEPIPGAVVFFGGKNGTSRLRFETDEEGRFQGSLPKGRGLWPVDIEVEEPALLYRLAGIDLEPTHGGVAEVFLRVPKTEIAGQVVNSEGQPASGAFVEIHPNEGPPTQLRANDRGFFSLRGLVPGKLEAEARRRSEVSERAVFELVEDREMTPLRLTLRATQTLRGSVRAGNRPVAGARIAASPLLPTERFAGVGTLAVATSGLDGSFRLELPKDVSSLQLRVGAPGFTYAQFRFSALPTDPVTLPLAQDGGTLRLTADGPLRARAWLETAPWLLFPERGLRVALPELRRWSEAHGLPPELSSLTVPNLPAGKLTACWFATVKEETAAFASGTLPPARCTEGWLSPGGELELAVRSPHRKAGDGGEPE